MSADASPRRRVRELRHEHADYIAQKRAEAHEAILLLERPTAQRVTAEREKDGLIIISAHYGRATNFSDRGIRLGGGSGTGVNQNGRIPVQPSHSAEHGEESLHSEEEEVVVDVTVPVQALVQDSRLYIPGGRAKVSRSVARVILRSTRSKGKLITP
jgi:DnaJ family protein C protein 11